jgi:hypothetical protein
VVVCQQHKTTQEKPSKINKDKNQAPPEPQGNEGQDCSAEANNQSEEALTQRPTQKELDLLADIDRASYWSC